MPKLTRRERMDLEFSRAFRRIPPRVNRLLIRLTHGRVGSRKRGIPIGLLTTKGRKTQKPRTVPVMFLEELGRYVIVASNGGYDHPPSWLLNLRANPDAQFESAGRQVRVRCRVVGSAEKHELWPRLVALNPLWSAYQTYTDRDLAVVSLEPEVAGETGDARR